MTIFIDNPIIADDATKQQELTWRSFLRRPTTWWLLLVSLCMLATWICGGVSGPPTVLGLNFISSCISMFAAMGIWLGVGSVWWRFLVIPTAMLSVVTMLTSTGPSRLEAYLLMGFFGALVIGVVATPIVLFRTLKNGALTKPTGELVLVKEALQFGIFHLMALTAGVAVLIPFGQWLVPILSKGDPLALMVICKLGLTLSIGSLIAVWATLGMNSLTRTGISALVICGLACLNYFFVRPGTFQWIYAAMTITVWCHITVLLWCLRYEGYRFVTRARTA